MIRRPPRSTQSRSSAASDVYKRQGDLFAMVHRPGDARPIVLNASGRAGSRASAATLRDQGLLTIPMRSRWSITVPGCVDGWEAVSYTHLRAHETDSYL